MSYLHQNLILELTLLAALLGACKPSRFSNAAPLASGSPTVQSLPSSSAALPQQGEVSSRENQHAVVSNNAEQVRRSSIQFGRVTFDDLTAENLKLVVEAKEAIYFVMTPEDTEASKAKIAAMGGGYSLEIVPMEKSIEILNHQTGNFVFVTKHALPRRPEGLQLVDDTTIWGITGASILIGFSAFFSRGKKAAEQPPGVAVDRSDMLNSPGIAKIAQVPPPALLRESSELLLPASSRSEVPISSRGAETPAGLDTARSRSLTSRSDEANLVANPQGTSPKLLEGHMAPIYIPTFQQRPKVFDILLLKVVP